MVQTNVRRAVSPSILLGAMRVFDLAVVVISALLAYYARHGEFLVPGRHVIVIGLAVLLTAYALQMTKLYRFDDLARLSGQLNKLLIAIPLVAVALLGLGFFTKTSVEFSRLWIGIWFAFSFAGCVLARGTLCLLMERWRRQGRLRRTVITVGAGDTGRRLIERLTRSAEGDVDLLGVVDERRTRVPDEIAGCPVLGGVGDLPAILREHAVDEIIVALPPEAHERMPAYLDKLKTIPVRVSLWSDWIGSQTRVRSVGEVGGTPVLRVFERPLSDWSYVVKAIEDRVLALVLLLLFGPLMALIALGVRLTSTGPALFSQKRYGFNNEVITVYKFRTMIHDRPDEPEVPQARRGDPRVTPLGRILRRTSFDELPQLFNVLGGDMSLVGPRPHAVAHNQKYAAIIDQYLGRHKMKPGITGWAQVNGLRGLTETSEKMELRIEHDLHYIDNWSLLFDLRILVMPVFAVLLDRGNAV
jgi:Undecaprenyl-phosphate glucose phosphotransferase